MSEQKTTEQILAERKTTHGEYAEHARCTQQIMRALMAERNWPYLSDVQKESLHMFAHKMGRIMVGNPDTKDHWDDIAGYARLVSQRLPGAASASQTPMKLGEGYMLQCGPLVGPIATEPPRKGVGGEATGGPVATDPPTEPKRHIVGGPIAPEPPPGPSYTVTPF